MGIDPAAGRHQACRKEFQDLTGGHVGSEPGQFRILFRRGKQGIPILKRHKSQTLQDRSVNGPGLDSSLLSPVPGSTGFHRIEFPDGSPLRKNKAIVGTPGDEDTKNHCHAQGFHFPFTSVDSGTIR